MSKRQASSRDFLKESPSPKRARRELGNDSKLQELLDFTHLQTDDAIARRFNDLARALLHGYRLVIRSGGTQTEYELLEVEFYLQKSGCHQDPFTHGSDEQKQSGQWYFHRVPRKAGSTLNTTSASGYRGGSRKGLDLTIGMPLPGRVSSYFTAPSADSDEPSILTRGGVLLRTIRRVVDQSVISGPSLLVDEILRASQASSITDLVSRWDGDISAFRSLTASTGEEGCTTVLYLDHAPAGTTSEPPRIYRSPRIGLDLSHATIPLTHNSTHPRVVYVSRPYRYFIYPHLLTANGRGQTFLGVLDECATFPAAREDKELRDEIVRLAGLKLPTVTKYHEEYKRGLEKGELRPFVGPAGKGASANPATFLRMMGTLRRLQTHLKHDHEP